MRVNKTLLCAVLCLGVPFLAQAQDISQNQALEKALSCLVVPDTLKFIAMDKVAGQPCYRFEGQKQQIAISKSGILTDFSLDYSLRPRVAAGQKLLPEPQLRQTALQFARRGLPAPMIAQVKPRDTASFDNGLETTTEFTYSLLEGQTWLPQGFRVSVNRVSGRVSSFSYFFQDIVRPFPQVKFSRQQIIDTYQHDQTATNPRGHREGLPLFQSNITTTRLFLGALNKTKRQNTLYWEVDIEGISIAHVKSATITGYRSRKTVIVDAQSGQLKSTIIRRLSDTPITLKRPATIRFPQPRSEMDTTL